MNSDKIITNLYIAIKYVSDRSYSNFLKSYKYNQVVDYMATLCESRIFYYTLFDYYLSVDISENLRRNIHEICLFSIDNEFCLHLKDENLVDLVEQRYMEYGQLLSENREGTIINLYRKYIFRLLISMNSDYLGKPSLPTLNSDPLFSEIDFIDLEQKNLIVISQLKGPIINGENIKDYLQLSS
ncbi:hypothetical protein [Candidatus Harpocratesius sp.]